MVLTGHSLKAESKMWELFMNLKRARNTFVHRGIAEIGKTEVSPETASKLVAAASEIIAKVREWLPEELHWPVFKHTVRIEVRKKLG